MGLTDRMVLFLQALVFALARELGGDIRCHITGPARCPAHNKTEGGVGDSDHIGGNGADVWFSRDGKRIHPRDVGPIAIRTGLFGAVGYVKYQKPWKDANGKSRPATYHIHLGDRPGPTVTF
jgi:hypothetical protein